jgi:putative nucleotidyltransferase with HDIG domain
MSVGKRRPKLPRANLRPTAATVSLKQDRLAREHIRALLLGLVALSVVATAAIVHGTGPPFTHRIGERPDRELRVNVREFRIRNQTRTSNERQAAADSVPPVMVNNPVGIRELAGRLDDLTVTIAKSARFDDVRDTVRTAWHLKPGEFLDLKAATDTPERRDTLHAQLAAAFEPIIRDGVLGPGALPSSEESSPAVLIRQPDEPVSRARAVPRERVVPERMLKPDGPVHQDFCRAFSSPRIGPILFGLIADRLDGTPSLSFEPEVTAALRVEARKRVPDHYDTYSRGEVLVEQGQTVTEEQLILLRLEHDAAASALGFADRARRALGIVALVAALFILTGYYVFRHETRVVREPRRVAMICGLVVLALALVRILGMQAWDAELVPVAIAGMIIAIAYNPNFALMVTFGLSLLTSVALGTDLAHFLVVMGGTAAGVLTLTEVRTRTKLIKVGATASLTYFLMTWATGFWQDQPLDLVRNDSLWRAGWGLLSGFFLGGSLPFIEGALGIVTGISLLELGDNTHPLLQELVRRAPGTHNHSITVGAIAESAAERVGADSLLVRIGAYYHDIGKMLKPHYFVENQVGSVNRHAKLAPAMSTLIIVGHVKDGVDLGRQHHLPEPIIDLIEQHHGTTLVEYFYHEASRRSGSNPDASAVPENDFRYPGPKPQTKEAAVLMVADAVESASRTLSDPTPARLEGLVSDMIDRRLRDGQFDECGLTLREIAEIRDSLIKSLIGIYHGRVKYPEQRAASG